ncbi:MAG: extensin family protein [Pseudomonadota bacterium]
MLRTFSSRFGAIGLALVVAACSGVPIGPYFRDTDAPWRAQTEYACLSQLSYMSQQYNAVFTPMDQIDGPRSCGAAQPLKLTAVSGGRVALDPPATLRCPMIPPTVHWIETVVQPAARRYFGQDVREIDVAASYSCRPRNNRHGAKLSEHGFANALDVSGFTLSDGRKVKLLTGYRGRRDESAFWREVEAGACGPFKTVLGPRHDRAHRDHFHFDLAQHGGDGLYCR